MRRDPAAALVAVALAALLGLSSAGCAAGDERVAPEPTVAGGGSCPEPDPPAGDGPAVLPEPPSPGTAPRPYVVEVVDRSPHDTAAFTQGLLHASGLLYEGTGGYGTSDVRLVDPASGDVLARADLPAAVFGEGLALHGGRLYQLTWTEQRAYVFDRCSLEEVEVLDYSGEGWGLATDGDVLWRSDGSATLRAHDPEDFGELASIEVTDRGAQVRRLNELELVDGDLLANVWQSEWIARIDTATGEVTGWIDASPLVEEIGADDPDEVLNGIAVDPVAGRLWLTGKRWPTLFEVRVVPGGDLPEAGLGGTSGTG